MPTNAPDVQTWKRHDLNDRLELLHMEDTLKKSVRTLTTFKQIWDKLVADYLHMDVMSQVANFKTLIHMNMNENEDVILLGLSFPSSVQSALLLPGLPPSWKLFISTKSTLANIILALVASMSQENIIRRAINQPSSSHNAVYIKHPKHNKNSYNKPR